MSPEQAPGISIRRIARNLSWFVARLNSISLAMAIIAVFSRIEKSNYFPSHPRVSLSRYFVNASIRFFSNNDPLATEVSTLHRCKETERLNRSARRLNFLYPLELVTRRVTLFASEPSPFLSKPLRQIYAFG